MITLEQVRLLDQKVSQAVDLISTLRAENRVLNEKLESYQEKIGELEVLLSGLKEDQVEVEQNFQKALSALDLLDSDETADTAVETEDAAAQEITEEPEESVKLEESASNESELEETEHEDPAVNELMEEEQPEDNGAELDIF